MAFSINRITLLGNVTRDPELKTTQSGNFVLKFGLATNYSKKNADNTFTDIPTFHNITVFGKMAEWLSKNIKKGETVYVDGRLQISDVEKDGVTKRYVDVIANNCIPTVRRAKTEQQPAADTSVDKPNGKEDINPEDIPF